MAKVTEITENNLDNKEEFDIEASFKRLEEILALMENKETGLKKSMELYAEGVELVSKCKENLEGVEKEIQILRNNYNE